MDALDYIIRFSYRIFNAYDLNTVINYCLNNELFKSNTENGNVSNDLSVYLHYVNTINILSNYTKFITLGSVPLLSAILNTETVFVSKSISSKFSLINTGI